MNGATESDSVYVSTGQLPPEQRVIGLVDQAYSQFRTNNDGETSSVYPALQRVEPDQFGICVASVNGAIYAAGDVDEEFTIMSVSKPFVLALIGDVIGFDTIKTRIGVNATGRSFNSVAAIESNPDGRTNPMVNSGAIATTSLCPGVDLEANWRFLQSGLSKFAGRKLALNDEVYASASETNHRNRSIAQLLETYGRLALSPEEATELYTRQCSLNLTARDLAVMGATLAGGGVNPLTHEQVISPAACHYTLAVMLTSGLYETSGEWLYEIGLPGKSGIGGGIVTVSPGKGGLGTFAPRLDAAGNSVKGQLAARYLSQQLGFNLLVSKPAA